MIDIKTREKLLHLLNLAMSAADNNHSFSFSFSSHKNGNSFHFQSYGANWNRLTDAVMSVDVYDIYDSTEFDFEQFDKVQEYLESLCKKGDNNVAL